MTFKYTQFQNTFATTGAEGDAGVDIKEHLQDIIKNHSAKRKVQQPLIKFGTSAGCRRLKKDIEVITAVVVEHDAGEMGLYKACEMLHEEHYPFVGHETWSHTEEHPRWRIILPLDKPLIISELGGVDEAQEAYRGFINDLSAVLGDGIISPESYHISQCWYLGHEAGTEGPLMVSNL